MEQVIRINTHTQLPDVGSYRGNSQVEAVNIFSLNSHATSKVVTCAERVIRRNTHTQLSDVESYRSNPPTESVNIFSLNSHTTHKVVTYAGRVIRRNTRTRHNTQFVYYTELYKTKP